MQAGWVLPLVLWHCAPWQRHPAPWQLEKRAGPAWSDGFLRAGRGGGNSERIFWPCSECINISILVWKVFCPADPFLEVCTEIVLVAARWGFPRSSLHRCCMFSLLQKSVLCPWIFPNLPLASGLWPQTKENSVMNVVNLKPIIVSKVNNGKTDYQQITLLRTQFWRDLVFPLTKQCHRNWADVCLLNLPIYCHAFPIA